MKESLVIILIALLYAKWIFMFFVFPWVCFVFQYKRKNTIIWKIAAIPGYIFERITDGGGSRYIIYQIGLLPSVWLRGLLYKLLGVKTSENVIFHYKTEIRAPYWLNIGKGSIIGDNALLDARNGLTIGENVIFSSNVSVYTEQHDHRDPMFRCAEGINKSVKIGNRVWIGSNVIILPGVKIGEGAVCCAGCVVSKDVAPYEVVAGIPAKQVNTRPQNLKYEFNGKSCWFY